jgi:hypothetical protein
LKPYWFGYCLEAQSWFAVLKQVFFSPSQTLLLKFKYRKEGRNWSRWRYGREHKVLCTGLWGLGSLNPVLTQRVWLNFLDPQIISPTKLRERC